MKIGKNVLIVLIFCLVARMFVSFPLDNSLPGGTDASSHLFKTWYIAEKGITKWNYYWYGGYPFLRYYPPLSYLFTGYLGKIIGYLFAYKLVVNLFFVIAPIAFYLLLKEFKLTDKKIIIALLVFSLIPIYSYYLFDGRHPTLISIVFALLYWKFLERSVKTKSTKDIVLSSIFLALTGLTHHLIMFLILGISLIWFIFYHFSLSALIKLIKSSLLGFLIISLWFIPFFLEKGLVAKGEPIIKPEVSTGFIKNVATTSYASDFYSSELSPYIISISIAVTGFIALLSFYSFRKRIVMSSVLLLIVIVLSIFIIRYRRILIFLPIPFSILVSEGFEKLKKRKIVGFMLLILLILSFFSLRGLYYLKPEIPDVPKDGRVLYLPAMSGFEYSYEFLFSPMNGNENILGWYPESQSKNKTKYNNLISNPLSMNDSEYYGLLKDGWVNYIVTNNNSSELIGYFTGSETFRLIGQTDTFFIFESTPKSSYIEIDDKQVDASVFKYTDKILAEFECVNGTLILKESYHKNWKGMINNKRMDLEENENGFIKLELKEENENCLLELTFSG